MNTQEAILGYQYSERIKSELIIASKLLATLESLGENEIACGKKFMISYLEALLVEVRIAGNLIKSRRFTDAEIKIMELIGEIELLRYSDANRCISEALSSTTSLCSETMQYLVDKNLL